MRVPFDLLYGVRTTFRDFPYLLDEPIWPAWLIAAKFEFLIYGHPLPLLLTWSGGCPVSDRATDDGGEGS